MPTHVSAHFRAERIRQQYPLRTLAEQLGYKNITKGANRIQRFEETGTPRPEDLLDRLAALLNIGDATIRELTRKDYEVWQEWLNEPIPMHMVERIIPAVYRHVPLPEGITDPDEAEEFAKSHAKQHRRKVCLVLSRRLSVWINEEGEVMCRSEAEQGMPNHPTMRIGRHRFTLDFRPKDD